jgi:hypothetical protein
LLVAGIGVQTLGVELKTTLWFLGFALTGTAIALAVVAVVGTWPRLMRPDNEGQILQGGKSFFAAMVMVTTFHITMMPAAVLWSWVTNPRNRITSFLADEWLPWILGIAASYAAVIAIIGFLVGGWNYRRLLAPR